MKNMESLMAVRENSEGVIGKFFYYSTSSILIPKTKFIEIGQAYGLPKFKPAKESKASAYRCATTAVKDRVTVKGNDGSSHVYRIYCRDNKKENAKFIIRELVKETLNSRTNEYKKLANIWHRSFMTVTATAILPIRWIPSLTICSSVCRQTASALKAICSLFPSSICLC